MYIKHKFKIITEIDANIIHLLCYSTKQFFCLETQSMHLKYQFKIKVEKLWFIEVQFVHIKRQFKKLSVREIL